jgi:hypothetical protein
VLWIAETTCPLPSIAPNQQVSPACEGWARAARARVDLRGHGIEQGIIVSTSCAACAI